MAEENKEETSDVKSENSDLKSEMSDVKSETPAGSEAGNGKAARAHRSQKVGVITSDKMQKTVVVRVDRLVRHTKYRRYVRRTSKFMAHDELGATIGDKVRIVETRPMSARKRWRVIEIVQKAAK
ncbi:MAG TPA: 30S ribosomal protein S17 [Pyrinomonadaceae bacterium]|nr:30S ribosomal protein S17 [Pyrinomonadaceae bacterium]